MPRTRELLVLRTTELAPLLALQIRTLRPEEPAPPPSLQTREPTREFRTRTLPPEAPARPQEFRTLVRRKESRRRSLLQLVRERW